MTPAFYIFGMQRSGTNYFCELMELNFSAVALNPGQRAWKHSIDVPSKWQSDKPTLVIHKNPYTWVESIVCREKRDWDKTQLTYPSNEIHEDADLMYEGMNIENNARTWKHFHDTWLSLETPMVVQYEKLLVEETREQILDEISERFEWSNTSPSLDGSWSNVGDGVNLSSKFKPEHKEYYKKGQPKVLSPRQIACITDTIGASMIRDMGY